MTEIITKLIDVLRLHKELLAANLPVIGVSIDGRMDFSRELTPEEQALADSIFAEHDPTIPTQEDLDSVAADLAKTEFRTLPQWAIWTPQEGKDFILQQIFGGQTQAEIDAWIDTNVTTLATAKTALKLQAAEIITIRTDLAVMAQAILYLRDVAIRKVG